MTMPGLSTLLSTSVVSMGCLLFYLHLLFILVPKLSALLFLFAVSMPMSGSSTPPSLSIVFVAILRLSFPLFVSVMSIALCLWLYLGYPLFCLCLLYVCVYAWVIGSFVYVCYLCLYFGYLFFCLYLLYLYLCMGYWLFRLYLLYMWLSLSLPLFCLYLLCICACF